MRDEQTLTIYKYINFFIILILSNAINDYITISAHFLKLLALKYIFGQ